MDAYPNRSHLGSPDALVGGPHHYDADTTPDIATCSRVGFPPLVGEASGQVFQRDLRLITHQAVY